jgi:hypothetical protein
VHYGRIARSALALAMLAVTSASASCHSATPSRGGMHESASIDATCPPGATFGADGCACRPDLRPLFGACVSARTAVAHCGAAAVVTPAGCAARPPCGPGRARDLITGECLARREVRDLAASLGILVADDDVLGCPNGSDLASVTGATDDGAPRLGCVPRAGPATLPLACPAGSVPLFPSSGAPGAATCSRVIAAGSSNGGLDVDVIRWMQAVAGADGGPGAPPLCRAWERAPGFLGSATAADARFTVSLRFPDNDVSLVVAEVRSADAAAAVELEHVLRPMIEALRALGGTARQAAITTTLRCGGAAAAGRGRPSGGARPSSVPAENDHEK